MFRAPFKLPIICSCSMVLAAQSELGAWFSRDTSLPASKASKAVPHLRPNRREYPEIQLSHPAYPPTTPWLKINPSPCISLLKLQSSVLSLPPSCRAFFQNYLLGVKQLLTKAHTQHATFPHLPSRLRAKTAEHGSVSGMSSLSQAQM